MSRFLKVEWNYSSIQQVFIGHQLCVKYSARHWRYRETMKARYPCSWSSKSNREDRLLNQLFYYSVTGIIIGNEQNAAGTQRRDLYPNLRSGSHSLRSDI